MNERVKLDDYEAPKPVIKPDPNRGPGIVADGPLLGATFTGAKPFPRKGGR